jgi:hypothetical protein
MQTSGIIILHRISSFFNLDRFEVEMFLICFLFSVFSGHRFLGRNISGKCSSAAENRHQNRVATEKGRHPDSRQKGRSSGQKTRASVEEVRQETRKESGP